MDKNQFKRFGTLLVIASFLIGCNNHNTNNRNLNNSIYEEIYLENFPNSTNICYNDKDFHYEVATINNNGSISGTISSSANVNGKPKCLQPGFILNTAKPQKKISIMPLLEPLDSTVLPKSYFISSMSTSEVTTGATNFGVKFNIATMSAESQSYNISQSNEYSQGNWISENGEYISLGLDFFAVLNVKTNQFLEFSYDGNPIDQTFVETFMLQIDNHGTAVGVAYPKDQSPGVGLICNSQKQSCLSVAGNDDITYGLTHISSNGQWIYGYSFNGESETKDVHTFQVIPNVEHPEQYSLKFLPILDGFIRDRAFHNITDDGILTVTRYYPEEDSSLTKNPVQLKTEEYPLQYFYVPKTGKLYYSIDFIKSIKGIDPIFYNGNIVISPNSKYVHISNENINFVGKKLGAILYFPEGFGEYLIKHVPEYKESSVEKR